MINTKLIDVNVSLPNAKSKLLIKYICPICESNERLLYEEGNMYVFCSKCVSDVTQDIISLLRNINFRKYWHKSVGNNDDDIFKYMV
jgi:hypothetical protein